MMHRNLKAVTIWKHFVTVFFTSKPYTCVVPQKNILSDPQSMQKFIDDALNGKVDTTASISENRNILQKLFDSIKEFIKKVSEKFSGRKAEQNQAARDAYGVDLETLKQAKNLLQKALRDSVDVVADKNANVHLSEKDARKGNEEKKRYSIKNIPDTDKVYVKADEQVIKSQDPNDWESEIFDYVNKVVRKGRDFIIPMDNEESITITERTAWKLSDKGNFANDYYMVKGNASGVIDEIISVSKYLRSKPPMKTHSDGFARYGFDYRKAYFMDLDGKYYELQLSVGINEEGREAYNIGKIKQVAVPSKRLKGPKGTTTSNDNVPQKSDSVNTQSMQKSEKNSQRKNSIKMDEDILRKHENLKKAYARMAADFSRLKRENREFRKGKIATVAKKLLKDFNFAYDSDLLAEKMSGLSEDTKQMIAGRI